MLRLYDNHLSGNGYKARLLAAYLGMTYERIELDILKGETRTPEFLAKNPNGRIPRAIAFELSLLDAAFRKRRQQPPGAERRGRQWKSSVKYSMG